MTDPTARFTIAAADADASFASIWQWLQRRYAHRPDFRMRDGLYWPRTGWQQRQINVYLGTRAGYQIEFRGRPGASEGRLVIRPHGALDDKLQVAAGLFGVAAAIVSCLVLLAEGLGWNTFIVAYPVRAFGGPHMSAGAVLVYAFVPSVVAGCAAFALAGPISWLARPLCRAANRAEGLPPLGIVAEEIAAICSTSSNPAAPGGQTTR